MLRTTGLILFVLFSILSNGQCLNGIYSIGGVSPDYPDLVSASQALNLNGVCGPVIFNINPGTYNGKIILNSITGSSQTNTITFQSANQDSTSVIVNYSSVVGDEAAFVFDNTANITIRQLNIRNTSTVSDATGVLISGGSDNINIENCLFYDQGGLYQNYAISYWKTLPPNSSNNIKIINSRFDNIYYIFGKEGNSTIDSSWVISGNEFIDPMAGILLDRFWGSEISGNTFVDSEQMAISIVYSRYMNVFQNTFINNVSFNHNLKFYKCLDTVSEKSLVYNNFFFANTNASYADEIILCDTSFNIEFSNNTIQALKTGLSGTKSAVKLEYSDDIRLLSNVIKVESGNAFRKDNFSENYYGEKNLFYITSIPGNVSTSISLLSFQQANQTDLNSWSNDPLFDTNGSPICYNSILNGSGVSLSYMTEDLFGQPRNFLAPDVGAVEFDPLPIDLAVTGINNAPVICQGNLPVEIVVYNNGISSLNSFEIGWTVNSISQSPFLWTGNLLPGEYDTIIIGNYLFPVSNSSIRVWLNNPNAIGDSIPSNDTIAKTCSVQLNGIYTIGGVSPDFATFTQAISTLNSYGVCGSVEFRIRPGTYNPSITIQSVPGTSATNTVKFISEDLDSNSVNIFSPGATPINLFDTKYIIFEKLTLGCSAGRVVNITSGVQNVGFYNCVINGLSTTNTTNSYSLFYIPNNTTYTNQITIDKCILNNGSFGFYAYDASYLNISNCVFNNNNQSAIYLNDIDGENKILNNIINLQGSNSNSKAIYLYKVGASLLNYDSIEIAYNQITNISGYGIFISSTEVYGLKVVNNFINTGKDGIYADQLNNGKIYFNTIKSGSASGYSAFYLDGIGSATIMNNIFYGKNNGYSISYRSTSNNYFLDNNNYFSETGIFGYELNSGNTYTNLFSWKQATGWDNSSYNVDPFFITDVDFHLYNSGLNATGVPISAYTIDMDGESRNPFSPDMGVDEIEGDSLNAGIASIVTNNCTGVNDISVVIKNFGNDTINSITVEYWIDGVSQSVFSSIVNIAPGNDTVLLIGSNSLLLGVEDTISVKLSMPNGETDNYLPNDSTALIIKGALGGIYFIGGAGYDYPDLETAVYDLNSHGICSSVIFKIRDGIYNGGVILNNIEGVSFLNTVLFEGESGDSSLVSVQYSSSGISDNYVIKFDTASYITFRNLTFDAQGTSFGNVIDFDGLSSEISFDRCSIKSMLYPTGNNHILVKLSYGSILNTRFSNNYFYGGGTGIDFRNDANNTVITGNQFYEQKKTSIYLYNSPAIIIDSNIIYSNSPDTTFFAIVTDSVYTYDYSIQKNRIYAPNGNGIRTYYLNASTSFLANNFISVKDCAIWHMESYLKICHNNIKQNQNAQTAAVQLFNSTSNVVSNNIYAYNLCISASNINSTYDGNNYFSPIGNSYAELGGNIITIGSWGVAVSEYPYYTIDPLYLSESDLHIANMELYDNANYAGLLTDIDNETRIFPYTTGADEIEPDSLGIILKNINVDTSICSGIADIAVQLMNTGLDTIYNATIKWQINGLNQADFLWSDTLVFNETTPYFIIGSYYFSFDSTYTIKVWVENPNGIPDNNTNHDTIYCPVVKPMLAGDYTVYGASPDFLSLNDAFTLLEQNGMCDSVRFLMRDGIHYDEVYIGNRIRGNTEQDRIYVQSESGINSNVVLKNTPTAFWIFNININDGFINFEDFTTEFTSLLYGGRVLYSGFNTQIINCEFYSFSPDTIFDVAIMAGGNDFEIKSAKIVGFEIGIEIGSNSFTNIYDCQFINQRDNDIKLGLVDFCNLNNNYFYSYIPSYTNVLEADQTEKIILKENYFDFMGNYGIFGNVVDSILCFNNFFHIISNSPFFCPSTPINVYGSYLNFQYNTVSMEEGTINSGLGIYYDGSNSVIIENNIFEMAYGLTKPYDITAQNISIDYNVINATTPPGNGTWQDWFAWGRDINSYIGSAQLIYPDSFYIQSTSPAINSSNSSLVITNDILGNIRDSMPDIGCYEYTELLSFQSIPPNKSFNFIVYPNPSTNFLEIMFSSDINSDLLVEIYDMNGRVVWFKSFTSNQCKSNCIKIEGLGILKKSLYLIKLTQKENIGYKKIIIGE